MQTLRVAAVAACTLLAATASHAATTTLNVPLGLALDGQQNLYVANFEGAVTIYNPSHALIGSIVNVAGPVSVAINTRGNIYVANYTGANVAIFDPAHQPLGTIQDSTLQAPTGMFVDGSDDCWVIDAAGVLHAYLDDNSPAGSIATGGSAVGPQNGGDSWAVLNASGGNIDWQNIGEALHSGLSFVVEGPIAPVAGAAIDSQHRTYITFPSSNQVWILSPNRGDGQVVIADIPVASSPSGIAVDSVRGRIYVSEPQVNQIEIYSSTAPYKRLGAIH